MADTTFVPGTVITSEWLNEVNDLLFNDVAQSGTKLYNRINNIIDVADYGAVGDGVTDDTDAIYAAFLASRTAGSGIIVFPQGTFLVRHGFNVPSNTTVLFNGCKIKATTTFSQGTIPTYGAISLFEVSHQTVFGADPAIENIALIGSGAVFDLRRNEQTGTVPGYSGIILETSDAPVQADLWKIKNVLASDIYIRYAGFDGWYVSGASDWTFRNIRTEYSLRVGGVVVASRRGHVLNCHSGYTIGDNPNVPAASRGPANSGDGFWNEPNNSWQSLDVRYSECTSYYNYQSGFKPYNAGADSQVNAILNDCKATSDCWDEVTQTRRSAAAEAGFRIRLNDAATAPLYIEFNNCVADTFERSGFQVQAGTATGGLQMILFEGCTQLNCNLSNTDGNNRSPLAVLPATGLPNVVIRNNKVVAPTTNTLGYGISVSNDTNVRVEENNTYFGTFSRKEDVNGIFNSKLVITTNSTYTVTPSVKTVIVNYAAGTHTITLPAPLEMTGRQITVRTTQNNSVISASANVVLNGGAASTAILSATIGKWATLQSDGSNWQIIANN